MFPQSLVHSSFVHAQEASLQKTARKAVDADVLLEGGLLYLGDGAKPEIGDVAIRGKKIVAIGQFPIGKVKVRMDCQGLSVSPGFIDLHNHSDRGITKNMTRSAMNFLTQGCTTILTGNCGSGPIDVGSYYSKLDDHGIGVNICSPDSSRSPARGSDWRRKTRGDSRRD